MGSREHGAKGLCQERAFVSGLEAGNALIRSNLLKRADGSPLRPHRVIPVRADEPQVVVGRAVNRLVLDPLEAVGIKLPWFGG
jgi:hypothetical protein